MIIDLDYTSEYPNIIRTLNISPETKIMKVVRWEDYIYKWYDFNITGNNYDTSILVGNGKREKEITFERLKKYLEEENCVIACNGVIYDNNKRGILASMIDDWFETRQEYSAMAKKYYQSGKEELGKLFDSKQYNRKIRLNATYGYLGLVVARYYDKDSAESITSTGRYMIKYASKQANKFLQKYGEKDYVLYIHTDSIFLHLDDVNINNVKIISKEVQDYTNNSLEHFCKNVINTDNKFMELKQEIIAKSALFLGKNRNALWVINEKGVDVDKIVVKGINTVSTSFPTAFKTILEDILQDILKIRNEKIVSDKLIEFKKGLKNITIQDLGITKSINGIEKYHDRENLYKKRAPVQVKSAINYNLMLSDFKLTKKHRKIKSGEKAKYVYLKENQYGYDTMAFREDSPEEILNFVEKYVDVDRVFVGELLNKIKEFYKACGWEIPIELIYVKNKKGKKKDEKKMT